MQIIIRKTYLLRGAFKYVRAEAERELAIYEADNEDRVHYPAYEAKKRDTINYWERLARDPVIEFVALSGEEYSLYTSMIQQGEELEKAGASYAGQS